MESKVLSLLDEIEEIVDRASKVPMTGKVLVDDSVIFGLLDQIRASLPEEMRNAQWIMEERQRIVEDAKAEAQKIMERAKQYAEKMAEESEIAAQAQNYAEDITKQAQIFAREIKAGAVQYGDEILQMIEEKLTEQISAVHRNREELRALIRREEREFKEKE